MPVKSVKNPIQNAAPEALEDIYREFEFKLLALKKEKDAAVSRIMRKIDDEKIKRIIAKIK